jgi:PAT family beta-lactamase induction signal transducer AmpG
VHVNAYRIAGLVPGSLSLILADLLPWAQVFWITAAFMLPGMVMVLLVSEPAVLGAPKTLRQAVVEPFHEFIGRKGWRGALLVLGFIFLYKLGDSLATALATPFYLDLGFSKTDIGVIAKHAGLWPAVFGGLLGGLWMVRLGINRALWLFGLVQMVTILGFAWLAWRGVQAPIDGTRPGRPGRRDCCRVPGRRPGYCRFRRLHRACHQSGFHGHPVCTVHQPGRRSPDLHQRDSAGALVESMGWVSFFILCFVLAAPGMLLLVKVAPWNEPAPSPPR